MGKIMILKAGGGTSSDELTATKDKVLTGYTAVTGDSGDDPAAGTMPNRGAVSQSLNAGGSYTIPAGYHNGAGKVTANSLSSQTSANATAAQILSGQTAWVNGAKVTGSMTNRGAANQALAINGSYTIPAGYHNGSGKVTQSVPVQGGSTTTPGTANKTVVAANRYVNGNVIVAGNGNLTAGNIKKGVSIFGVTGTFQGFVDSPIYFYNKGTWSNLQTKGFTGTTNYAVSEGRDILVFHTGYYMGNVGIFRLNQTINLSSYNYIKIEASSNNYTDIIIGFSTNSNVADVNQLSAKSQIELNNSIKTAICDIAALSGNYYLYVCAYKRANTSSASGSIEACAIYATTT